MSHSVMLTLHQMQNTETAELRSIAKHTPHRQYAIACDQMAAAQEAHLIGDSVAMKNHVAKAKIAHARAQEDEHGQVLRVRATAAQIAMKKNLRGFEGHKMGNHSKRWWYALGGLAAAVAVLKLTESETEKTAAQIIADAKAALQPLTTPVKVG